MSFIFLIFPFLSLCSTQFIYCNSYSPDSSFTPEPPSWLHGCITGVKGKTMDAKSLTDNAVKVVGTGSLHTAEQQDCHWKLLWHFCGITKARGSIQNFSSLEVQHDKWLWTPLSCNYIQLNKYSITQGALLLSEKYQDRTPRWQNKHGPGREDRKPLTRPKGRSLSRTISTEIHVEVTQKVNLEPCLGQCSQIITLECAQ